MTLREKMLAVYEKRNRGEIPWAAYTYLFPRCEIGRLMRNRGCGLVDWCPVVSLLAPTEYFGRDYESEAKDVEISMKTVWEDDEKVSVYTYDTPVGSVFEKLYTEPGYHSPWRKKYLISSPDDYKVVKLIVENTVYRECPDAFLEAQEKLGDDGVVIALWGRTPWQKMLVQLVGPERLFLDLQDNRSLVEDLLSAIEKREDEAYRIMADSPAEVIWFPDNVTGDLTPPKFFEKYSLPFYNKQGKLLHRKNKSVVVHCDGKLKCLKDLIKKADVDVIESFSLPEAGSGGDLSIEEASSAWKDKSIVANLPASLSFKEENVIRDYFEKLLQRVSPRKNFMLELSEDVPYKQWNSFLPIVADVMENQ